MPPPLEPLFLERQNYRRRRLGDAARFLPVLGFVLFLLPILWAGDGRTAGGMIYVFSVWALLIAVVAFLSRRLTAPTSDAEGKPAEKSAEP